MAIKLTTVLVAALAALSSTVSGLPAEKRQDGDSSLVYLVTTQSYAQLPDYTNRDDVRLISLFSPSDTTTNLFAATTAPGYTAPIPQFDLDALRKLSTFDAAHGGKRYMSFQGDDNKEMTFVQDGPGSVGAHGIYDLRGGYLLGSGNQAAAWSICDLYGQKIIKYKAEDPSCVSTYIHAVKTLPY